MDKEMIWGLLRLAVILVVIIPGAIYTARWYGKRQTPGKNLGIKEALSLGPNKALYLVEWTDKVYLIGVTNQTITLLDSQELKNELDGEVD